MENNQNSSPAGKTLLIVDDEFGVLEVLEFILKDSGYTVVSALNGREALARLQETKPDLAIIDFMMPILDGNEVIKAMRADDKLRDIPIILTSALPER
jgi:two-component system, OmpR family, response regulator VicR